MFTSLRGRLLAWYTAILAVVIVLFGAGVCYVAWRTGLAEVDARLASRAAALAAGLRPASGGTFDLTLPTAVSDGQASDGAALYHVLWTAQGAPIDRSNPELDVPIPEAPGVRTRGANRELAVRAPAGPLVLTGQRLTGLQGEIWSLATMMAAAGAAALAFALAGGTLLAARALTPIDRISRTARQMAEGDLGARIPAERVETELGQLAGALNEAFDRLHASLGRQRRFTADASHELRTPLATISTETQWALARERQPDEYRESLAACRRAADRMQSVVERLLALARDESGAAAAERDEPVRLDKLVDESVHDVASLAASRGIHLDVPAAPPITVIGDPARLLDAITNIVVNAVQYNVYGGHVRVTLEAAEPGAIRLRVADTGIGIEPEALPRVFEPFFRADPARSRAAGGSGLGLAVARSVVERHGGRISCASEPSRGTEVVIDLPLAPGHGHT